MNKRVQVNLRADGYRNAVATVEAKRDRLRQAVLAWKEEGATVVEIAQTLGWSRQSVYDLING